VLNVYRPIPNDLLAATQPVHSRRVLRFFLNWYDAISGVVTAIIALLLVLPLLASAPWMALWPAGYVLYQTLVVTYGRRPDVRRAIVRAVRAASTAVAVFIYGQPEPQPTPTNPHVSSVSPRASEKRISALVNGAVAFVLVIAALVFIISVYRVSKAAGVTQTLLGASWLLFFLPVSRAARYATFSWLLLLAALVIIADTLSWLVGVGRVDGLGLWIIAVHICWLTLISLLPAITLRYLSERRADLSRALSVVRQITALTTSGDPSETAFANRAAAIIAGRMGYDDVNILLATSDDERIARGLRFYGASSDRGRDLVEAGYVVTEEQGITGWCANHGAMRLVNDVQRDPDHLYLPHPAFPRTRAEIAFPLILDGETVGVLDVQSERPFAFDEDDEELLRAISQQLAMALDGVRRLTRARGLTAVTSGIARRLLVQQELRPALDEIVGIARETLNADSVVLYPRDPERGLLGDPYYAGAFVTPPASAARVRAQGERSAVAQALHESAPRFERHDPGSTHPGSGFVTREGIHAAAILPLRAGQAPVGIPERATEALGVIFVNYREPRLFQPEYREWCAALADLAALALQSAMLYQRVAEEERANTWRDIHDGMAQHTSMGRMLLEQVVSEWRETAALSATGGEKLQLAREAIGELQRQVNYLIDIWRERDSSDIFRHEDDWMGDERPGFFNELEEYASLVRRALEIDCELRHDGDDRAITHGLRHDALMIIREAVNNANRHGRAKRIEITVRGSGGALAITVRDNGRGFDTTAIRNSHGIMGMKERVEWRHGTFDLDSSRAPGASGVTIRITLPLAGGARNDASPASGQGSLGSPAPLARSSQDQELAADTARAPRVARESG
jgi:GAF domain-containing protein